jgi:ABC-type hemin transport system ATPase subunit
MQRGRLAAAGSWEQVLKPAVLEEIYDVQIRTLASPTAVLPGQVVRPVFDVQLPDSTLAR